jgi:predicted TIM-barrel fold metal-dependent hydrolase
MNRRILADEDSVAASIVDWLYCKPCGCQNTAGTKRSTEAAVANASPSENHSPRHRSTRSFAIKSTDVMFRMLVVVLVVSYAACCSFAYVVAAQEQESAIYDHHVHVLSPRLISDWKSLGMTFGRPDNLYFDSEKILNQEQVAGAFLISMAHLYSSDEFRPICKTLDLERRLVAAENDYVAVSVARSPNQFVGFFSVNPLKEFAFDELRRCRENPNLTGLKLHLPTCGIDLDNPRNEACLKKVLAWAAENKVPVLLHWTAGEEIDLRKSLWFWSEVIHPHAESELYLAHLGSVGGFNSSSSNVLRGFALISEEHPSFKKMKLYFDLSGAIIGPDFAEARATSDESCKELSKFIEMIGVEKFLFASDYPVFSAARTRENLAKRLHLSEPDLKKLLSNKSPRFAE